MVEWFWQGKIEALYLKLALMTFCPPQIAHGLARDRIRTAVYCGLAFIQIIYIYIYIYICNLSFYITENNNNNIYLLQLGCYPVAVVFFTNEYRLHKLCHYIFYFLLLCLYHCLHFYVTTLEYPSNVQQHIPSIIDPNAAIFPHSEYKSQILP